MKEQVILRYPSFKHYYGEIEKIIADDPMASSEELILFQNRRCHVRKRHIKTTFFSGLLPDTYKYLTVTYAVAANGQVVFLLSTLHDYID
jgi:hypothetical protein